MTYIPTKSKLKKLEYHFDHYHPHGIEHINRLDDTNGIMLRYPLPAFISF